MGLLEKIRRWIDGEEAETALENVIRESELNPKSQSEEFIVRIARAIEEVISRELVRLPQGTILIPSEYVVFMSKEDDAEWRGVKRKALTEALYYILGRRAKELAAGKKIETKRLTIDVRVDASLEKGEIRVQHTWDDGSSGNTSVFARQRGVQVISESDIKPKTVHSAPQPRAFEQKPTIVSETVEPTLVDSSKPEEDDEATRVAKRITEFYKLEVWWNGVRQNVLPIYQPEIIVGRGSRTKPVDVALQGDLEVSRNHLRIIYENGNFYIVAEGKNPTFVENKQIPLGQKVQIFPGMMIKVCSYLLRIQASRG